VFAGRYGDRFVGEDPDPDLAPPLDVSGSCPAAASSGGIVISHIPGPAVQLTKAIGVPRVADNAHMRPRCCLRNLTHVVTQHVRAMITLCFGAVFKCWLRRLARRTWCPSGAAVAPSAREHLPSEQPRP